MACKSSFDCRVFQHLYQYLTYCCQQQTVLKNNDVKHLPSHWNIMKRAMDPIWNPTQHRKLSLPLLTYNYFVTYWVLLETLSRNHLSAILLMPYFSAISKAYENPQIYQENADLIKCSGGISYVKVTWVSGYRMKTRFLQVTFICNSLKPSGIISPSVRHYINITHYQHWYQACLIVSDMKSTVKITPLSVQSITIFISDTIQTATTACRISLYQYQYRAYLV